MFEPDTLEQFAKFGIPGLAIFVFWMIFQNKFEFKTSQLSKRSTAIIAGLFLLLVAGVVVIALFLYKPSSIIPPSQDSEKLSLSIDSQFTDKYSFVYSVVRPGQGKPRVYELGTWYRIILNNQSKEKINITKLKLIFDGKLTANDTLKGPFFDKISYAGDDIRFIGPTPYPIELESKQYKAIYAALPLRLPSILGECALQAMHDNDSPKDSMIEVFLYGERPIHSFSPIVTVQSDAGEQLIPGEVLSSIQIGDLALTRMCYFHEENGAYEMIGYYENDDGFRMLKTTDLFNTCTFLNALSIESLRNLEHPTNHAVLVAETSLEKEFSIALKPSPSLLYLIQDTQ